ncbi:MAG TPA: bifunctional acetate--CoA ligase family protein/GNAT family N-acetyltransferase [Candidatus Sulfotelmatobacter sp.]|nr:bifunctional acetate--CoA ligase family protein/GNAT family N-acetyltransferase [Candidatus Sulfotelmatobacter sp.]
MTQAASEFTSGQAADAETGMAAHTGLDALFHPRSVAVIGATERSGTVGRSVLANLQEARGRIKIYAVNPSHNEVLGIKTQPHIGDIPGGVDLAMVVTPAPSVPQIIGECVDAGVRSAVVISAGFREQGREGAALEEEIQKHLRRSSSHGPQHGPKPGPQPGPQHGPLRMLGPNCMGFMNPSMGLNATFAHSLPQAGSVAFLSQSGALQTAILDWSRREHVGFSAIVSTGSMLDVGWGDLIYHFGDDPHTKSILLYMESVGDARSFVSAAREIALTKPIIVIKGGRSDAASRAAASHTGALIGSDEVLDAAFRRCGVLRVQNIADLFYMAETLSKQPRPRGPRLTIVTNAGGPGVLATDALLATGGELTVLSPESLSEMDGFLSPHWSHGNPVDVLADADAERFVKAAEVAANDPRGDGLLAIIAPQGLADPTQVAERMKPLAHSSGKPVLASWMGADGVAEGTSILNAAGIPTFSYADTAARAFTYMWRYTYNLRGLYETPTLTEGPELHADARTQVSAALREFRSQGRTLLNEFEAKNILASYGIPVVETRLAKSEDEAAALALEIGYPVVLKLSSSSIAHKTDVDGVRLDLRNEEQVREAYRSIKNSVTEKAGAGHFAGVTVQPLTQPMVRRDGSELILGSSVDLQFGPVILFGSGGVLVDVYRDRALALPPLNSTLAQRLMEQTRIFAALKGVRGRKPVNLAALEAVLVRFSQLVVEQPWIKEIDINPLLATPERILALDARMVLHDSAQSADRLPHPAIRPYPSQYVREWRLKDGTEVTIRPIRPEDEPLMVQFHATLSERSVYLRYFCSLSLSTRVEHERLVRICFGNYDRAFALVADRTNKETGQHEILGVGRLSGNSNRTEAEAAVLVSDRWHGKGLGTELLSQVVQVARAEGFVRAYGEILRDNLATQAIFRKVGFRLRPMDDPSSVDASLAL